MKSRLLTTRNVVFMGMFSALAAVLMLFEFPLPFIAPSFYGLDLAEVPILVGSFASAFDRLHLRWLDRKEALNQ